MGVCKQYLGSDPKKASGIKDLIFVSPRIPLEVGYILSTNSHYSGFKDDLDPGPACGRISD